ncbi:efflux transporter outer membrane subunit [Methylomicrobium sp. Wu6]|uniref:efflux transporter outer membrane subunit n=1 Tax=Methylomicrobium sp. Wu6 TaxID=3107928 RepID=UPI002DD6654D|nr:efflux transporter outer membrane subunit [Methylomicrobium sp. Wu6]MEC4748623.1 efflux transporter outer membrane subunit [Methylomicrobium sp. Wu6]
MNFRITQPLAYMFLTAQLTGCMVGPDYVRPEAPVSAEFKELKGWKQAQPRDTGLPGKWWEIFNDSKLNELEEQVAGANQSIVQAEAQYRQAQHLVQSVQSSLLPTAMLTGTTSRFKAASGQSVAVSGIRNLFGTAVNMAWEPDLWGSIRRQVEANTDLAQASDATLRALLLSTQATLAQNYFQLRVLDAQKVILEETVAAYSKTLEITKNRYAVGVVAKADVLQAETQLESAQAQTIALGVQRAALEHAIAVLIGKTPAELTIAEVSFDLQPPPIPVALPSELLERRPDIAAAEREAAAANAQIGVAKAAYYPTLNLAVTSGHQSSSLDTLFTTARRYWALGPAGAALTLFDGGAKNAQYKQAIDAYDASVAAYRQIVLTGFQEVEDNLAALRILEDEKLSRDKAVRSAEEALALTNNQYRAGTVNYINVLVAQTVALTNRQTAVLLQGDQLVTSVLLVKALGGGWNETMLPSEDQAAGKRKWTDYLILPVN